MRNILLLLLALAVAAPAAAAKKPETMTKVTYTLTAMDADGKPKETVEVTEHIAEHLYRREQSRQDPIITDFNEPKAILIQPGLKSYMVVHNNTYADPFARKFALFMEVDYTEEDSRLDASALKKIEGNRYKIESPTPNVEITLEIDKNSKHTFAEFARHFMMRAGGEPDGKTPFDNWTETLKTYPKRMEIRAVMASNVGGGKMVDHYLMEMLSVEEEPYDHSVFEAPEGYTMQEFPTPRPRK